jgi:hypothetical protein
MQQKRLQAPKLELRKMLKVLSVTSAQLQQAEAALAEVCSFASRCWCRNVALWHTTALITVLAQAKLALLSHAGLRGPCWWSQV